MCVCVLRIYTVYKLLQKKSDGELKRKISKKKKTEIDTMRRERERRAKREQERIDLN